MARPGLAVSGHSVDCRRERLPSRLLLLVQGSALGLPRSGGRTAGPERQPSRDLQSHQPTPLQGPCLLARVAVAAHHDWTLLSEMG